MGQVEPAGEMSSRIPDANGWRVVVGMERGGSLYRLGSTLQCVRPNENHVWPGEEGSLLKTDVLQLRCHSFCDPSHPPTRPTDSRPNLRSAGSLSLRLCKLSTCVSANATRQIPDLTNSVINGRVTF